MGNDIIGINPDYDFSFDPQMRDFEEEEDGD